MPQMVAANVIKQVGQIDGEAEIRDGERVGVYNWYVVSHQMKQQPRRSEWAVAKDRSRPAIKKESDTCCIKRNYR